MKAPLIVAGMHRPEISILASFLGALGVDMGDFIVPEDRKPERYSEELSFQNLNSRMLASMAPNQNGEHRDREFAEYGVLDSNRLSEFREEARTLVETRSLSDRLWGWTDPRATMLLDFWNRVVDDVRIGPARFVLLYGYPWNLPDSICSMSARVA